MSVDRKMTWEELLAEMLKYKKIVENLPSVEEISDIIVKTVYMDRKGDLTGEDMRATREMANRIAQAICQEFKAPSRELPSVEEIKVLLWNYIDGTPGNSLNNECFTLSWGYCKHIAKEIDKLNKGGK